MTIPRGRSAADGPLRPDELGFPTRCSNPSFWARGGSSQVCIVINEGALKTAHKGTISVDQMAR